MVHHDFIVRFDPKTETQDDLSKKIFYSLFIRRIQLKKPVICFVGGDCLTPGTKILMADGTWKKIEDIKTGEQVISPQQDGKNIFSTVISTTNYHSTDNYAVRQLNKQHRNLYTCSGNHKIPVCHLTYHRKNGQRLKEDARWHYKNYQAQELFKHKHDDLRTRNVAFSSFLIESYMGRTNCKIEPYSLGVYIGNGTFTHHSLSISSMHKRTMRKVQETYPTMSICDKKNTQCKNYNFSLKKEFAILLEEYGLRNKLSGDKFIPESAMLSDSEYRKKLLAGLIDTDGSYYHGGYSYVTKSPVLAQNVLDLVYSLGGRGNFRKITKRIKKLNFVGEYYHVSIYLHDMVLPLQVEHKKKNISCYYKSSNRIAIALEKASDGIVYGISIDSPSHYLVTDNWMVTSNSGEGKSWSVLKIQMIIMELMGLDLKDYLNDINVYIPIQYPEKLQKILYDKRLKKVNMIAIHEARDIIKAKLWHSFVSMAVADVNAQVRSVKRMMIFIVSQFIRDITTDMRYTLTYYMTCYRPMGGSGKTRIQISKMWKDDRDLEKPSLKKYRVHGVILFPDGTHRRYYPKYLEVTSPPEEITREFDRMDTEAKSKIIKGKLDKMIKEMQMDLDVGNPKVDAMVNFYSTHPDSLKLIGRKVHNKWKLAKDTMGMHDLTKNEFLEFSLKLDEALRGKRFEKDLGDLQFADTVEDEEAAGKKDDDEDAVTAHDEVKEDGEQ